MTGPILIKPAELTVPTVNHNTYGQRSIKEWIRNDPYPIISTRTIPCGIATLGSCLIDFGSEVPQLGTKIRELKFGSQTYVGVLPMSRREGSSVVECRVDYVEDET